MSSSKKNSYALIPQDEEELDGIESQASCGGCCSCVDGTCWLFCGAFYRWFILLFVMFLTFGSYWVFDTPGALAKQLEDWFPHYTDADNLNLYAVYSYPNTVLCFFGGFILDRITGVRLGAILFCFFILAGETLFAFGVVIKQYYVCLVGRFIFGLGGESLTVAQNTYTARWFDGAQLALAFGLVLSFARIGSSVNFAATPFLAQISLPFAIWFGAGTCVLSFIACIMLGFFDWAGRKRVVEKKSEEVISFKHILRFPFSTWLIYLICVFFYIGILTFYAVASKIMQNTGHMYPETTATLFISIPNFVSIIASPTFGWMIDKVGRALIWIFVGCLMLVIAHIMFLGNANEWFGPEGIHPVIIMVWLGVGYAMFAAAIWPLLPFIIPPNMLGTAYGAMTAVQNAGLAIAPQVIGFLQSSNGIKGTRWQYTLPLMIFIGCATIALVLNLWLIFEDMRATGGRLNSNGQQKREWRAKVEELAKEEEDALIHPINADDDEQLEKNTEAFLPRSGIALRSAYLTRLGIARPKEFL